MKKIFIIGSLVFPIICYTAVGVKGRYNVGLYNSAVETLCSRISSGIAIEEEEIRRDLNFMDSRETSPSLDAKYGQVGEFERVVSLAYSYDELKDFTQRCKTLFQKESGKVKTTVHFLLDGVIAYMAKNRKSYRKFSKTKNEHFDNGEAMNSFLKMFHLDNASVDLM